jgi:hypothetical protein
MKKRIKSFSGSSKLSVPTIAMLASLVVILAVLISVIDLKTTVQSDAAFYRSCESLGGFCTARSNCTVKKQILIACKGNQVCCRPTAPTVAPSATVPPANTVNVSLFPVSGFTPNGRGNVSFTVTKNSNGYWDFLVLNASYTSLEPNRSYQLHLCGENGCSSHSGARFTTNNLGNGSFGNVLINHNQWNNPITRVVVYEYITSGPIPTDPKSCPMVSLSSTPCLKASLSF